MAKQPLIILIRDGWGYRESQAHNAIKESEPLYANKLMTEYPTTLLDASGKAVGLPEGYMGNSEVGHITIGSGRIILEALEKINHAITSGEFFENEAFLNAIQHCKEHHTTLHLIGLLQKEGVHSHLDHLYALLDLCQKQEFTNVKLHVITDGRDAPVTKSEEYVQELEEKLADKGFGEIVTVSGRYYAMDRDQRWERTQKAYETIVNAKSERPSYSNALELVKECHLSEETDEFIIPRIKENYQGIQENDAIIFHNFRTDRPRQFTQAMVEEDFTGFTRKKIFVHYVAMTKFYKPMNAIVAFQDEKADNTLGEVLSNNNLKQLRISETEKYAHVTFFFNVEREEPYPGEDRIIIPSPKVATYDSQPEMSAQEVTQKLVEELDKDTYDVVIVNIVNGDMVGHTGVHDACLSAVRVVDECVKTIVEATLAKQGTALVFADHGNIEDQTDAWRTSHTKNKVPFILVSDKYKHVKLQEGKGLQDVAPTALKILGIEQPTEMTGENIIE